MVASIVLAIFFLCTLYVVKNGLPWSGSAVYQREGELEFTNALVEDVLKKDLDGDGVLDWEEALLGLDPSKTETTPGTPDITVANKLRAETTDQQGESLLEEKNLTETDKFARELFSTVTALEQSGSLDQATAEKIVSSLSNSIQNSSQKKIYTMADIKISGDNSPKAIATYNIVSDNIYTEYELNYSAMDVFQKFIGDGTNIDIDALADLDPIIKKLDAIINAMLKIDTPRAIALEHLNLINATQKVVENLSNVKLYENDSLIALGAIVQYEQNVTALGESLNDLGKVILKQLNN